MAAASDRLLDALETFFASEVTLDRGDLVLVAFSGGIDSTALLWGLHELERRGNLRVLAAHLDHALDEHSAERALRAAELADEIGATFTSARIPERDLGRPSESLEAWAREVRYDYLDHEQHRTDARYIATAHQLDDQIETVVLRLLFGSGLGGLSGIPSSRGTYVRPLLSLPRSVLQDAMTEQSLRPIEDPTNLDLDRPRNRIRHRLLPALRDAEPGVDERILTLAAAAKGAMACVNARLGSELDPQRHSWGADCSFETLIGLPSELWPFALALLHRTAGLFFPPGAEARAELRRQVMRGGQIGCDCGNGWRWEGLDSRLAVMRHATKTPRFTYTVTVPGEVSIPEISLHLRVTRESVAPWMFRGSPTRAALLLPIKPGDTAIVRNRRPGDRIQPLGCPYRRRLKELFIDHRVPQRERDRIPLLQVGDDLAWVPGITIHERFRLQDQQTVWVATIEPEKTEEKGIGTRPRAL